MRIIAAIAAAGLSIAATPLPVPIVTALPVIWAEGAIGDDLREEGSAARTVLDPARFVALSVITRAALGRTDGPPLVLAQPRLLAPAELVAIDQWVRAGGRVVIFTDPDLAWESAYPLGDRRRPPMVGLLDPLLTHWGLELLDGDRKRRTRAIGHARIATVSAGGWRTRTANCRIADPLVATCNIGKGRAVLVADADLLHPAIAEGHDNAVWAATLIDGPAASRRAWWPALGAAGLVAAVLAIRWWNRRQT